MKSDSEKVKKKILLWLPVTKIHFPQNTLEKKKFKNIIANYRIYLSELNGYKCVNHEPKMRIMPKVLAQIKSELQKNEILI